MRSSILEMTEVIDMGLKSEGVRGAVTLGTGCIDADFHCVGTRDEASDMFSMSASGAAKTGAPIHKNHDGMLLSPVAVGQRVSRALNTRPSVMCVESVRLLTAHLTAGVA